MFHLIAILLSLAMVRYLSLGVVPACHQWYQSALDLINPYVKPWGTIMSVAAFLLPIPLLTCLIGCLLSNVYHGILGLLIDFLVLWYCFGPGDVHRQLQAYLAADDDASKAKEAAAALLGATPSSDIDRCNEEVNQAALWQFHLRIFAVLFWFTCLGVFGALLYRLTTCLRDLAADHHEYREHQAFVKQVLDVLDWLPGRLLAFGFILAGNFTSGGGQLVDHLFRGLSHTQDLVKTVGRAALGIQGDDRIAAEQLAATLLMLDWTLIIYLGVYALAVFVN